MQALYRQKWTADLQGDATLLADVRDSWAEILAGLTAEQLRAGYDRMKIAHPTWPPTPMEFRMLCISIELPSTEQAYAQAISQSFQHGDKMHPAVQIALDEIPKTEWRLGRATEMKKLFCDIYEKVIKRAECGEITFNVDFSRHNTQALPTMGQGDFNATEASRIENSAIQNTDLDPKKEISEEQAEKNKVYIRSLLKTITQQKEAIKT